ncbi:unnamed protein product [Phaeothamnion confervicola]
MRNHKSVNQGIDRPYLYFEVREKPKSGMDQMTAVAEYVKSKAGATGIVYCMTKTDTEQIALYLISQGVRADFYHAGQTTGQRQQVQTSWQEGEIDVVVATIAYGMGIDKSDVRYVLHFSIPKSIAGYYQEAGRAGRDGKPAECVLMYRREDISKLQNIIRISGKGGRATKERHGELLEEMRAYCEQTDQCRKVFLEVYFGSGGLRGSGSGGRGGGGGGCGVHGGGADGGYGSAARTGTRCCVTQCDVCCNAAQGPWDDEDSGDGGGGGGFGGAAAVTAVAAAAAPAPPGRQKTAFVRASELPRYSTGGILSAFSFVKNR